MKVLLVDDHVIVRAEAAGYLSKSASPEELLEAVRRVAEGARYIGAEIAQAFALQAAKMGNRM